MSTNITLQKIEYRMYVTRGNTKVAIFIERTTYKAIVIYSEYLLQCNYININSKLRTCRTSLCYKNCEIVEFSAYVNGNIQTTYCLWKLELLSHFYKVLIHFDYVHNLNTAVGFLTANRSTRTVVGVKFVLWSLFQFLFESHVKIWFRYIHKKKQLSSHFMKDYVKCSCVLDQISVSFSGSKSTWWRKQ